MLRFRQNVLIVYATSPDPKLSGEKNADTKLKISRANPPHKIQCCNSDIQIGLQHYYPGNSWFGAGKDTKSLL